MAAAQDYDIGADDIYLRERGRIFLSGIQALVRLPLMQHRLDRLRGHETAGLISGYRGSPLGGYDQQLWRAAAHLRNHEIVFQPGLNEDLAATALWGAQIHRAFGDVKYQGVFGIWYGKGPGVDRSADVFRNANIQGTAPLGGVLALAADDHGAQSSMFPHQTDGILQSVGMPILQPATVAELLTFGLAGIALSRYSGLWVAMKTITEVVESAGSFELPDPCPQFTDPTDFAPPPHGLNWDARLRWPAQRHELERRLHEERLPAARAFAAANGFDRIVVSAPQRRFGIVTVGKAHQDLLQALADLGIGTARLAEHGISIYKVGMSWPLSTRVLIEFASGLEELLVIEEKQGIVEEQIKQMLYHMPAPSRPRVVGKRDEQEKSLLPQTLELDPLLVARALVARFGRHLPGAQQSLARLERAVDDNAPAALAVRKPYFCAGCPHNTSTRVPDGSIAGGGIGCHVMALDAPELRTATFSQMGGEGIQWVGAAPFVATPHIFQNLGDGTYQHSGLLAIRAAIVAGTNVTYKILLNDAVAMTGGQAPEGSPDPIRIARTLQAEGISALALVSDAPEKWRGRQDLPPDLEIVHRDGLDGVQKKFRTLAGASVILYEQTCASEKRKRRKRKAYPDPDRRIMINARVCEGCGDCSVQSRCIAIEPVETPYGRKRQINQSSCNKDYSCSKGFCPSFVEIAGAQLPQPAVGEAVELERRLLARVPAPSPARPDAPINIYIAGVGGAGVLTLGALLGAAAHVEGHNVTVLDFTGLAQKNGAVVSQVRIAVPTQPLAATRIGPAAVDLMIGADLVAAAAPDALVRLDCARSAAVLNLDVTPTAQIIADADAQVPVATLRKRIAQKVRADGLFEWNASRVAQETFGDPVYANVMLLGYAWQKSLIPISDAAIERAIALNGVAVELNTRAFRLGRIAAFDLHSLSGNAAATAATPEPPAIDELPDMRAAELARYQDAQYANLYRGAVAAVRAAEQRLANTSFDLTRAAAENLFKLMAYKDEYEVARLYSNGEFESALRRQFAAVGKISVWLAPPLLSGTDPATGRPRKRRFGPWIFKIFRLLAALKGLRGTGFDPFGWTAERRLEREAVNFYLDQLALVGERLTATNYATALELLRLPERIRGFGPVKVAALQSVRIRQQQLTSQFVLPAPPAHKLGASGGRGEWAEWPDRSRSSG